MMTDEVRCEDSGYVEYAGNVGKSWDGLFLDLEKQKNMVFMSGSAAGLVVICRNDSCFLALVS